MPHTGSQWAAFHGPNANARHNTVLHNTNTHRSGLDQNAIFMLCSRGHRIYTVTSLHLMLGEPSAAQSERFGGFLCSWRSIKNSSFNFLYTSSTLKHLPHHHSSHVHAVFFFFGHCSQNVTVAGVDGSEFYARRNKHQSPCTFGPRTSTVMLSWDILITEA